MRVNIFKSSFVIISLLLLSFSLKAQDMNFGIALKGSTMGVGGDVVVQFNEKMSARLGLEMMKYNYPYDFEESTVHYDANASVKTGSITALYDYHLSDIFFISAGLGINNFNISTSGTASSDLQWGDIEIPAEKIGGFEINLEPSLKISPYVGIGVGQTINPNGLVSFCFEIGTYYQGSPSIEIVNTEGFISPTSNPERGQKELFESQLSQYYLYPVIKLSLSFKIYSL